MSGQNRVRGTTIGTLYASLLAAAGAGVSAAGRGGLREYVLANTGQRPGPIPAAIAGLLGALGPILLAGLAATSALLLTVLGLGMLVGDGTFIAGAGLLGILTVLWFARPIGARLSGRGERSGAQILATVAVGAVVLLLLQPEGAIVAVLTGAIVPTVAAVAAYLAVGGAFQVEFNLGGLGDVFSGSSDLNTQAALWAGGDGTEIAFGALILGFMGALAMYRGLGYAGQLAACRARAATAKEAAVTGALIALPAVVLLLAARTMVRIFVGAKLGLAADGGVSLSPSVASVVLGGGVVAAALGAIGGWRAFVTGHAPAGGVAQLGYPKTLWWGAAPIRRARDSAAFILHGLGGRPVAAPLHRPPRESMTVSSTADR